MLTSEELADLENELWDKYSQEQGLVGEDVNREEHTDAFTKWVLDVGVPHVLESEYFSLRAKHFAENPPDWFSEGDADGDGKSDGAGYWDPSGSDTLSAGDPTQLPGRIGKVFELAVAFLAHEYDKTAAVYTNAVANGDPSRLDGIEDPDVFPIPAG